VPDYPREDQPVYQIPGDKLTPPVLPVPPGVYPVPEPEVLASTAGINIEIAETLKAYLSEKLK